MSKQKHVGALACLLFAVVAGVSAALARELEVDWKLYGGVSTDDGHTECFYDAKGVILVPDTHIRVCIKNDFEGKILKNTTEKMLQHYVPPVSAVETANADQVMDIVRYEETANIGDIEPDSRILYELNCPERMVRELSIYVRANGKSGSVNKPSDWKFVPPEGNGARLLKILCPLQKLPKL